MADSDNKRLTELTEDTDLSSTDIGYIVVDPGGTPLDRKFEVGNEFSRFQVTTLGDTLYGTAAATLGRLAIGSSDQIYSVVSGIPAWATLDISLDASPTLGGNLDMSDKQAFGSVQTITYASDITIDLDAGVCGTLTLTGTPTTVLFTNVRAAATYMLQVTQDGTGDRGITWDTDVTWPAGTAPTLSTDAAAVDVITFVSFDGTTLRGVSNAGFA